ncbi:MAG: AAA family ATPase [Cyanobacteria bacterium SBLK]|nr:AAA family ATPase [Cyanobacteria bacterium SBLK]
MLKNITIEGYKSIKKLDLELTNLNVFIGANGAGKSNFISFFKLLKWMIQSPGQLQYFIGQSGGGDPFLFDGLQTTSRFQAELNFETSMGRNDYFIILSYANPEMTRYDELLEKNQATQLTGDERLELTELRKEADLFMLRKAQAIVLLRWRGHQIMDIG